jgi:predicted amidohydrolase YtcJ
MAADRPADLILRGGRIATMDRDRTVADAVAVRDGRIVGVGSDTSIAPWIGPRSRVVELRGRSVTPGFGDAHVHPVTSGIGMLRCDLQGLRGLDAYLETVARYAVAHPDAPWIVGDGWSMADFPGGIPDRADLDRVSPDRPVYLESRDGHTAWVNSAALAAAGIDAHTPDPDGGRIERDVDGRPRGALQESAMRLVERLLPETTADELIAGLRLAQAELHALGITHWQDASVRPEVAELAYTALAGRGELTARVIGALLWDRTRGTEQLDELVERRARTAIGRYAPTSVKLFVDGVIESFTAAVLEPYLDAAGRPTAERGTSQIEPDALRAAAVALGAQGFQAHFHAIGERAVREALDAVEAARRANGPDDTRPHIAHIQVIHPDDVPRFARHDVIANAQPYWAVHDSQMDELTIPFLGPERTTWQYPFRSLLAAGATLAMGSDWAVSTADPLIEMEVAVTRVSDAHRGDRAPFLPDERLDLDDALAAFTEGSAWVNHLETRLGTIEVGKTADLAVFDRDLFDRGAGAIGETRVVATFIDGVAVHERPDLEG